MKVNKQKAETRDCMGTRVLPLIMGARLKNCRSECEFLRSPKNFPHTQQGWVCGRLMAVGQAAISEDVHDRGVNLHLCESQGCAMTYIVLTKKKPSLFLSSSLSVSVRYLSLGSCCENSGSPFPLFGGIIPSSVAYRLIG